MTHASQPPARASASAHPGRYGTAPMLTPGPATQLATGHVPSRQACQVERVLGARHLAQTALTALAWRPSMFAAGV